LFRTVKMVDDGAKLADLDLDFVYVTTPIPVHFPVIKTLYLHKVARNLFVEKTLASSWDEAEELCKLAESYGDVNMVGYMKRFAVTFRKAKNLLGQGILGEPTAFNAYAYSSDFSGIDRSSEKFVSRGGVLEDLGSHVVDLAYWFFGNLEVDSAVIDSIVDENSEDYVHFTVKNSDLQGQFKVSWCMENYRMPHFELRIKGDKGDLKVNDDIVELRLKDETSSTWYRHDLNDNVHFLLGEREYYREDKYFIDSILDGNKAEPSFRTASRVDYIIDQVKRRASEND
jgi:predicted dehydrogenase